VHSTSTGADEAHPTDSDHAALNDVVGQEIAAWEAGDADRWLTLLADDVEVLPPNTPMLTGKDAARAFAAMVVQQIKSDWEGLSGVEIVASGSDFALARTLFKVSMQQPIAGGAPIVDDSKAVHLFRRQADGTWKVALEM
jgi:uncharacterized protein (TIGR02246 family)